MAEEKDFMDQAVEEYFGTAEETPQPEIQTNVAPVSGVESPPADVVAETVAPVVSVTDGDVLREFNKITGMNIDNIDRMKELADAYSKIPEYEEKLGVIPELIDALEKTQNPLSYFPDETAFKVAQLTKDPRFKGKDNILNEILRSNLDSLDDIKVIGLSSQLKARDGVRNPMRAELKSMGLNPDDILDDYENIDDDTKDLLKIRADQFREDLAKIGVDVKAPAFEGTSVEKLLSQKKTAREDRVAMMTRIQPIADNIISEIKEIKVTDDFSFKLDLTPDQKKSYTEELTEILASGQYDIKTDDGKREVYGAIMDMFKSDFFEKVIEAVVSHKTKQVEENMRRANNNEVPLGKNEPNPFNDNDERDLITRAAELLVSRGF